MKKLKLSFLLAISCFFISSSVSAEKLGSLKLFKTYRGNPKVEMTLVQLGELKEKRILAYFNAPGFALNGEYNIYQGQCQTTHCKTIVYKVIGGTSRNIISKSGYFGDYFEVLLPGRREPLGVYYDKKQPTKVSNDVLYSKYLVSVGRDKSGSYNADHVKKSIGSEVKALQAACQSTAEVNINADIFRQKKLIHLVGMGVHYLKEITLKCADADYREELSKITTINFLPFSDSKNKHTPIKLSENELSIYLSNITFNPKYEAKLWLENL